MIQLLDNGISKYQSKPLTSSNKNRTHELSR